MSLLVPDTGLLFWMTLSFGVVLFILVRYAFPRILQAIDARNEYINRSLDEARQAGEKLEAAGVEAGRIREEAQLEYTALMDEAQVVRRKMLETARLEAEAEMRTVREKAAREIEASRQQAVQDAAVYIIDLSAEIAGKALGQSMQDAGKQKELISRLLKEENKIKSNENG